MNAETCDDRPVVVVTADSHVGPMPAELREYCEQRYLEDFDRWVAPFDVPDASFDRKDANQAWKKYGFTDEQLEMIAAASRCQNVKSAGAYDARARRADMDFDGVTAEVIFHGTPNPAGFLPLPFTSDPTGSGPGVKDEWSARERELAAAGRQIYNRWLADFGKDAPERHVGIAHIPIWDLDASVEVIQWAAEQGLRGINFPSPQESLPPFEDTAWDRFLSVSEDLGMALVTHTGGGRRLGPNYTGPAQYAILLQEMAFLGTRNVWHFVFAGVFDRHSNLKVVITEVPGTWFETTIPTMDSVYDSTAQAGPTMRCYLKKRPSEYVASNVFLGVSFMSKQEARSAVALGLTDVVMWGSDYPHAEGTYVYYDENDPQRNSVTRVALANTFAGIGEADVRKMVGGNAIRCYGLDAPKLATLAKRIGPSITDLTTAPSADQIPDDYIGLAFRTAGAYS